MPMINYDSSVRRVYVSMENNNLMYIIQIHVRHNVLGTVFI